MRIPPLWRPLRIEGCCDRGQVMLGDGDVAIGQVKWWRPGFKRFKPDRWIASRMKGLRTEPAPQRNTPAPEAFEVRAWAPDVEQKKRGERSFWYGYCGQADLAVEVVVNTSVQDRWQRTMIRRAIPSLEASGPDEPVRWSIFDTSFTTPPGFDVSEKQLLPGDICLAFVAPQKRRRLIVRQIYPAELALERRDLQRWLRVFPFKERRIFAPSGDFREWAVALEDRELAGFVRTGTKKWAFPFGWLPRLKAVSGGVHDEVANRLLLAMLESTGEVEIDDLAEIIADMNWARPEWSQPDSSE